MHPVLVKSIWAKARFLFTGAPLATANGNETATSIYRGPHLLLIASLCDWEKVPSIHCSPIYGADNGNTHQPAFAKYHRPSRRPRLDVAPGDTKLWVIYTFKPLN